MAQKDIVEALMKRARGYDLVEVSEEYSANDGELSLSKRKVTTKSVPP